ncbi:MAG: DUF2778 domain-containing protein [Proteobacteria bacterium]|uniref:Tlde1 domain-containing protein n=1 Tax=Desulfomicrobium macestii TaxID=90731 RepID=A0ABR9H881_9BACT|nr:MULTISPECIES: tlde1 domain-containing protein [Desulfomicrobium]MBE1426911.1 hypothetical protein [Desulfomicrobium macestii]NCC05421.1 DUF2778 domain-containing protein [Pseudomonadota bacterium]
MPWIYDQQSGRITGPGGEEYQGYSGHPPHRNQPASENIVNEGPIPRGSWRIDSELRNSAQTGQMILLLNPVGHTAHGRRSFQIHGDSARRPGLASSGCIVLPRNARIAISQSGDTSLIVR